MNTLRQARKAAGLTQMQLAEKTGILQSNLSWIERGMFKTTEATRNRIESALGCKIDWIANSEIRPLDISFYKAEQLIHKVYEMTLFMDDKDKTALKELISKYFR